MSPQEPESFMGKRCAVFKPERPLGIMMLKLLTAAGATTQDASLAFGLQYLFVEPEDVTELVFEHAVASGGQTPQPAPAIVLFGKENGRENVEKIVRPMTILPHGRYVVTVRANILQNHLGDLCSLASKTSKDHRVVIAVTQEIADCIVTSADVR